MTNYRRGKQIREYQAICYFFYCRHLCFVGLGTLDIVARKRLDCDYIYTVRAVVETDAVDQDFFPNRETRTATVLLP